MKKNVSLLLALTIAVGLSAPAFSFGLKNLLKTEESNTSSTSSTTTSQTNTTTQATSGPMNFQNTKFGYSLKTEGGWQVLTGDTTSNMVMFHNPQVNPGGFTINATAMQPDFPIDASLQAQEKDYKFRKDKGDLTNFYRKDFEMKSADGKTVKKFQGYVTVESDKDNDPDIQRLQWIGYGQNHNYYNFTWSTDNHKFTETLPEFEKMLGQIQFQ